MITTIKDKIDIDEIEPSDWDYLRNGLFVPKSYIEKTRQENKEFRKKFGKSKLDWAMEQYENRNENIYRYKINQR